MLEQKRVLAIGSVVSILGTSFDRRQGVVVDLESDLDPEDGPVAVFFDQEVPPYLFTNQRDLEKWKGEIPTHENYRNCPRVVCFLPEDLRAESRFSNETLAHRLFGRLWHSWAAPKDPMTETTECMFDGCSSCATEHTLLNFWGTVYVVYACGEHHKERNGMFTENLGLKSPKVTSCVK